MGGQALPENAAACLSDIGHWSAPNEKLPSYADVALAVFAAGVGFRPWPNNPAHKWVRIFERRNHINRQPDSMPK